MYSNSIRNGGNHMIGKYTYGASFETEAIVSMDEVVEYLYNREIDGTVLIDDEMKAKIDAYYEQYGVVK